MKPKPLSECQLYTFVDTAYLRGRDPVEVARQLCAGGADLIQLRAKELGEDEVRALAEHLLPVTRASGVHLVVNDHPKAALQAGAAGCHLGQEDFFDAGYRMAAQVTGCPAEMFLGLSTHAPDQARRALRAEPDYIAIGPVYATPTKAGVPAVTLEYVRWAAVQVKVPWFAIGGINESTLDAVLEAGARRICVVSAILEAPDVERACQRFRQRIGSIPPGA